MSTLLASREASDGMPSIQIYDDDILNVAPHSVQLPFVKSGDALVEYHDAVNYYFAFEKECNTMALALKNSNLNWFKIIPDVKMFAKIISTQLENDMCSLWQVPIIQHMIEEAIVDIKKFNFLQQSFLNEDFSFGGIGFITTEDGANIVCINELMLDSTDERLKLNILTSKVANLKNCLIKSLDFYHRGSNKAIHIDLSDFNKNNNKIHHFDSYCYFDLDYNNKDNYSNFKIIIDENRDNVPFNDLDSYIEAKMNNNADRNNVLKDIDLFW